MTALWFEDVPSVSVDGIMRCGQCERALIGQEDRVCTDCAVRMKAQSELDSVDQEIADTQRDIDELESIRQELARTAKHKRQAIA